MTCLQASCCKHPFVTAESWAKEVLVHCCEFLLAELPSLNQQKKMVGASGIESTSTIQSPASRQLGDEQLFELTHGPIGTTGSTTGSVGICSTRDGLNTTCKLHRHAATVWESEFVAKRAEPLQVEGCQHHAEPTLDPAPAQTDLP